MSENLDPGYTGEGMYRENIIDHYKNPHNKGSIEDADAQFTENNATCGDVITVQLKVKDGIVKDIKFQGRGCAISQAAMSMLTGEIKGKSLEKAKSVKRGDIVGMFGIEIGPVRTKCATLGMVAVKNAIKEFELKKVSVKEGVK
ncbi:SUF system NifU family Fe-S cluster assembly protein [Candidatus Woesearchaeota archaeon]|nr:SUF system NifU family Fe-S cluster assembly protein [Candidatus Woesearchaeota archaeon]